jgi:hypothetical protein
MDRSGPCESKGRTVSKGRKEPLTETNITTSQAQENEYLQAMISEPKAELAELRKPVAEKPEHRKQHQDNLKAAMETVRPFVDAAMAGQ